MSHSSLLLGCRLASGGLASGLGLSSSLEALGSNLANGKASSLSVDHDSEAVEVAEILAGFLLRELLGGGGGDPLVVEIECLARSIHSAGASSTQDFGHDELGKGESAEGVQGALHTAAINEYARSVSDVDNDARLAVVLSEVNESNSACLNELSESLENT